MPATAAGVDLPHVVIVGGGFAGLEAARTLRRAPVQVTLVDKHNYHLFQPLLYQVAMAGLNPSDIAYPLRKVLRRQRNAAVFMAEARAIDPDGKRLLLTDGEIAYDYLVLATGATHSYFGHDEWAHLAPGLKTVEDAIEIRQRVLFAFEAAEREPDPLRRRAWLTFVVVGGGATGVELAGSLAEIARFTLAQDFRNIDPAHARVILLEGAPRVLPPYPESLSEKARRQLEALGVEVRTGSVVTGIDREGVSIGEQRIEAYTVLWGAGVQASPLARCLDVPLDRAGRVLVEPDLSVPGHPEIFVVGDLASVKSNGKPVPGVAPAALQGGRHAARSILRSIGGKPRKPFHYVDKGSLATIGRARAVADIRGLKLWGFAAWMAWLLVHIFFLIGFRNRFLVMFEWAWSYVTFERGARLITGDLPAPPGAADGSDDRPPSDEDDEAPRGISESRQPPADRP